MPTGKSFEVFIVDTTTKRETFPEVVALEEGSCWNKGFLREEDVSNGFWKPFSVKKWFRIVEINQQQTKR